MENVKQIGPRISLDSIRKLEELVNHFQKTNLGRVTKDSVVDLAIRELYLSYIGEVEGGRR